MSFPAMESSPSRQPFTLLFVDDDSAYVAVAQHVLATSPYGAFTVVWKRDGASALEEVRSNRAIDLIILDYYLTDTEGFELLRQMREEQIVVPVILLTSQREFRLAVEALRYGVEDYLLKDDAVGPVLPRTIQNVLERAQLERQIAEQQKADLIAQKQTDAVRELVVTVCHEFNNPLAAIKISTDILLKQPLSEAERQAALELDANISRIEEEIRRLRELGLE